MAKPAKSAKPAQPAQPASTRYRRAGAPEPALPVPFARRWYGKAVLVLLSVGLLSLAFAPVKQFYLAWVGLVPWLIVLRNCRSQWRAFGWSWVAGTAFFSANMWWLGFVTGPGLVALMAFLGLYWAAAGVVIRGCVLSATVEDRGSRIEDSPSASPVSLNGQSSILDPRSSILCMFGIAAVWAASEWVRGAWPLRGLPWLYLGHSQTPALYLCQIADVAGELGVSFWVAMLNAWVALFLLNRLRLRGLVAALAVVLLVTAGVAGYGWFRFSQWPAATTAGPTVLVVQPNFRQTNTGEKGASLDQIAEFHLDGTERALGRRPDVDLVVWSETMMPALNRTTRQTLRGDNNYGDFAEAVHQAIQKLAAKWDVALLVGGPYFEQFRPKPGQRPRLQDARETRNTAYYYPRGARAGPGAAGPSQLPELSDLRYDKIHLVPFGEYIPFKETIPPLYHLLMSLGPTDMEAYQLTRGDEDRLTAFPLSDRAGRTWRFVTPICFEDIDGPLVARMFRPSGDAGPEGARGGKRADFIVNITNDGWFRANEMPLHLQAAQFRSIENRAPTARSVNTGISGFIDSMGRPYDLVGAGVAGTSAAPLRIDARLTLFTRFGNVFAIACSVTTGLMALAGAVRWWSKRRNAE